MDEDFFGISGTFEIVGQIRASQARYAQGITVGDTILLRMNFGNQGGGYGVSMQASMVNLYLYDKTGNITDPNSYIHFVEITQNEFFKYFKNAKEELNPRARGGSVPIFQVVQIS